MPGASFFERTSSLQTNGEGGCSSSACRSGRDGRVQLMHHARRAGNRRAAASTPIIHGASMLRLLPALVVALVLAAAADAAPKYRFGPFKDELFKTKVLGANFGGAYTVVEFVQARDLDGRDEIPEKK